MFNKVIGLVSHKVLKGILLKVWRLKEGSEHAYRFFGVHTVYFQTKLHSTVCTEDVHNTGSLPCLHVGVDSSLEEPLAVVVHVNIGLHWHVTAHPPHSANWCLLYICLGYIYVAGFLGWLNPTGNSMWYKYIGRLTHTVQGIASDLPPHRSVKVFTFSCDIDTLGG